ncbi:MAG: hypothetical protein QY331_16615 [Melioribacteraceae bacterium]|nr:hypothetical protein [Melioribacteraceae bacterium]WKZ69587.1 MAG: hypothetical protein QY331_16615 [Melioribacteraceae bacterium]
MKKFFVFLALMSTYLYSQEISSNPTRPSAADNAYITEYGYTEIELGWFAQEDYWSVPALLKITPIKKVELGFIMSGIVNHSEFFGNSETSVGDFGVQLKGQLLNVPEMAIALVGRADFLPESITRGTIYSAFSFPRNNFQVDATLGGFFGINADALDTGFLWAVALGSNFENPFNFYVEVFGENVKDYTPLTFDAGISYKITPTFVIDAAYYSGLNDHAIDWQFHVGFTTTLFKILGR